VLRLFSLEELLALSDRRPTCLAVGVFDGVHRGHRVLLARALELARTPSSEGVPLRPAVFTFQNNPLTVLRPIEAPPRLSTIERRLDWIEELGIELALAVRFDESIAQLEAMEFLKKIVVSGFGARVLVCGPDFRFGHGGAGNAEFVREVGGDLGLSIEAVPPLYHLDAPISSSRIRRLIVEGHVAEAAALLGRPHEIEGIVIPGKARGRTIGYPTANIQPKPHVALPRTGVYAVQADAPVGGPVVGGMMNLGYSPTFGDIEEARVEAHFFDFSDDLKGKAVRVRLVEFLREEQRFASVEDLVAQLRRDEEAAREAVHRWEKDGGNAAGSGQD